MNNHIDPQENESIDLLQLLAALRSSWRFLFFCGAVTFVLVVGITLLSSMEFKASARLYLGEVDTGGAVPDQLGVQGERLQGVVTEVEILRSRYLARKAVVAAGANVLIAPTGWRPPNYFRWRWSGRDLKLTDGTRGALRARDVQVANDHTEPITYEVRLESEADYALYFEGRFVGEGKIGVPLRIPGLSITLVGGEGTKRGGCSYMLTLLPIEDVVDQFLSRLTITQPENKSREVVKVLELQLSSENPYQAAEVLNSIIDVYLNARQAWKTEDASAAEVFISKQLQKMRDSLDRTQEGLANFRRDNRAVISEDESTAMIQQLRHYEEQRVAARLQVSALRDLQDVVENPGAPLEAFMFGEAEDSVLQGLAGTLSKERQRLSELKSRFKEEAPDVKQQRRKVADVMQTTRNYVSTRLNRARKSLKQLNRVIEEYEVTLKSLPIAEIGLEQIGRESEVYNKMFSQLLERQQQTALLKASTVSKNRVLDRPRLPTHESSPSFSLRLASGIIGLLFGAFIVVVRTLLSSVVQTDAEVRARFNSVPVLASVPRQNFPRRKRSEVIQPSFHDIMRATPENFPYLEAFRTLRTNLMNMPLPDGGKVVAVTSPSPKDGKTTCVLSLAAALAANRKRVMVIDADIRKPCHHHLIGISSQYGLKSVLMGEVYWQCVVQAVKLSRGGFHAIVSEQPSPAELLSAVWLPGMLMEARALYDFVLIDMASYPFVADPLVVGKHVDLMVSVVRVGQTGRKMADEHMHGIQTVARSQAIVINGSTTMERYGHSYDIEPAFAKNMEQKLLPPMRDTTQAKV
ncbi:MAG: hypothetical protein KTR25_13545 [Myxococcales bacterium]|nr:hypothetical protein [Myxococcales bacterium]